MGRWEQTYVKFLLKYNDVHSRKCLGKCRLQIGGYFVQVSMCSSVWSGWPLETLWFRSSSLTACKIASLSHTTFPNTYFMMTSSNGNIFRVTDPLCGEFTGHRWIPLTKGQWRGALMFSLIYALNKRLSKQSWGWWLETPSRSLWRHCNIRLEMVLSWFRFHWSLFLKVWFVMSKHWFRDTIWRHQATMCLHHYTDVIMGTIASQIASLTIVYWTVYSKLRVIGLCAGNSLETGEFPAQMASNAKNVSIWWRHHDSGTPFIGTFYLRLDIDK